MMGVARLFQCQCDFRGHVSAADRIPIKLAALGGRGRAALPLRRPMRCAKEPAEQFAADPSGDQHPNDEL